MLTGYKKLIKLHKNIGSSKCDISYNRIVNNKKN